MILKQAVEYRRMIDVLLNHNLYADLVFLGGRFINVITREIYTADVAVKGKYILMIGKCGSLIGPKTEVVELNGKFIAPGFIDSHMHFESSMLTITEFCRLSIPSGTTTLIADPHEIANVLGLEAIKAMAEEAALMPGNVYLNIPCFAPDSPEMETCGAPLNSTHMIEGLSIKQVLGIGEIQGFSNVANVYENTPWVVDDVLSSAMYAKEGGKVVDGNAPGLFGKELAAHIICGGGRISCHETTEKDEMLEKLRNGVYVFMREGSTQRNMAQCIKAVTEEGLDSRRMILATDDMLSDDLKEQGHMNDIIRRTIAQGIDPVEAIQMATVNPAEYFGLKHVGALTPGLDADIVIISDLMSMTVDEVYIKGEKYTEGKNIIKPLPKYSYPESIKDSVKVSPVTAQDLYISSGGASALGRAIVVIPDQNLTETMEVNVKCQNGAALADVSRDILLMACIERHGVNGNIGKSFVKGMGFKFGAIAESIAHDSHNIMVAGTDYEDMAVAVNAVIKNKGGLAVAKNKKIIGELSLKVGGLMSDELTGYELSSHMEKLHNIVKNDLKGSLHAPFMHLSFLALTTSEKWKITDKGIVDVKNYKILTPIVGG